MNKKLKTTKQPQLKTTHLSVSHQQFSGPIPPPMILEQYQTILPSAPERIVKMAEEQQDCRLKITAKIVNTDTKFIVSGQILGFLLFLVVAALSAYALFLGYEKFAILGMVLVAVPLVKTFVLGKSQTRIND